MFRVFFKEYNCIFQEALQLHLGDEKPPQPNASPNVQETSHIPENGNKRLNTRLSRGMFVEFSFPVAHFHQAQMSGMSVAMFFNITEETNGFESSNNIKPHQQHPVFSFLGVVRADYKHAYTCSQ